jgi:hypothetical protein
MIFGSKTATTDTAHIDLNQTYSTNVELDRELYERVLQERQRKHLERIQNKRPWQPCMHDQCQSCHGTGINAFGSTCIHSISCPCPKCTPTY